MLSKILGIRCSSYSAVGSVVPDRAVNVEPVHISAAGRLVAADTIQVSCILCNLLNTNPGVKKHFDVVDIKPAEPDQACGRSARAFVFAPLGLAIHIAMEPSFSGEQTQ